MQSVGRTAVLVHGYTMADVDALTQRALRASGWTRFALDVSDRWDCAWHAIVERLYENAEPPSHHDLVRAAGRALAAAANDDMHHRGVDKNTYTAAPHALKYWIPPNVGATDGFTEKLIELAALPQVLGRLTPQEYEVLATVAVHGTHQAAADVLGLSVKQVRRRLKSARDRFFELWFEHETPPARWGQPGRCKAGHSMAEHGFQTSSGRRRCRLCMRNYSRRHNLKRAR